MRSKRRPNATGRTLAIVFLFLVATSLCAQTDAGALRVLVVDASQAIIPNVEVRVINTETNTSMVKATNEEGYAVYEPIPRGTYLVEAALSGFRTVRTTNVTLDVNERRMLRITMEVSPVTESIEVSATTAPLRTEEASLGQVVKGNVAVELPLAGRRYSELALLAPGATASTLDPTVRGYGWFVANGNYHTQNNYILDGFDNNQGSTNAQALSAQVMQPSPDALSEFKVQTNAYSAEFGRGAGAVVNASIRSGGNQMHGSAWYYNRDSTLAANSWATNLIGGTTDPLKWHQFGASVGGPIKREKLFYFGDYEGFRRSFSSTSIANIPTLGQRQGIFNFDVIDPQDGQPFTNRTIPATRFDPLGKKVMDLYPAPNQTGVLGSGGRVIQNFGKQLSGTENTHKFDIRNDYYATEKNRFFGRYSFLRQGMFRDPIFGGPLDDGLEDGPSGTQYNRNQSVGVGWTRTISANTVNEMRFGYNRTWAYFAHAGQGAMTGAEFGFKGIPPELDQVGGIPLITFSNYYAIGTPPYRPQYQKPQAFQILNSLAHFRGAHSLKAGFEMRFRDNEFSDLNYRVPAYRFQGRFTGDDMADLLIGYPDRLILQTQPVVTQRQQAWSGFFLDDWKLRPRLTLNLGLRYEYTTPFYALAPYQNANFDFQARKLVFATDSDRYLVNPDRNNFAPRVGIAYLLKPDRLVLRGGYGIFYSGEEIYGMECNLPFNPPSLISATLQQIGTGPPPVLLSGVIPSGVLSSYNSTTVGLRARLRDLPLPMVHQWNVALEFQLPHASTFELAYVGNRGRNIFGIYQANQTPFGVDGSVAANRPYPEWSGIQTGETKADSTYNALQARFERRYAKGWYMLTSYTFASALDESGGWAAGNSPQSYDNWAAERGPQAQTPRHRLSLANIWQLPVGHGQRFGDRIPHFLNALIGGWQMSNIVTLRSGLPVNVSLASNGVDPITGKSYRFMSRNGGSLRPNRVGDPLTGTSPHDDRFHFLDANAYRVQLVDTAGNAARSSAHGPSFVNFDISVVKQFNLRENVPLDLRLEMFNMFNTTNFRNPSGSYGSSSFGVISSAYDPRIVQVAARVRF